VRSSSAMRCSSLWCCLCAARLRMCVTVLRTSRTNLGALGARGSAPDLRTHRPAQCHRRSERLPPHGIGLAAYAALQMRGLRALGRRARSVEGGTPPGRARARQTLPAARLVGRRLGTRGGARQPPPRRPGRATAIPVPRHRHANGGDHRARANEKRAHGEGGEERGRTVARARTEGARHRRARGLARAHAHPKTSQAVRCRQSP